ncbi:MAG TPA: hypothetical protein VFQ85_01170 [Mycobacteriales bacterium]|jgi:hypothetical protein|nr:hypothetical protein [Mycobacteriales bacterium]
MAEETWHSARLIPTSGINGAEEQERRATSALLAVMSSVREFGRSLTGRFGAPAGVVETYIEVPFHLDDKRLFPDGLIRVTRGSRVWTALVEVKTGTNELDPAQLEAYLDIAREQGFDALLTISNQIPAMAGTHPTPVDRRKLKKVALHHLSWTQVLTEAVVQKVHRGVADPDQAWILGELIRYLEHPKSGAMEFDDMGVHWVPVRESIAHGTIRPNDKGVADVASRWDQLIQYLALRLGRQLGTEVQPVLSRRELTEPALRSQAVAQSLATRGAVDGSLRIPGSAGVVTVTADLRAGRIVCSLDIEAPREGRPQTRVNWLLRQLKAAPDTVRIDAFAQYARGASTSELLRDARSNPALLVGDAKRELRTFRVTMSGPMGSKRGQGRGSFVASVAELLDVFYTEVVQTTRPRTTAPPRLREPVTPDQPGSVGSALVSTALSSQDGAIADGGTHSSPVTVGTEEPTPAPDPAGEPPAMVAEPVT